MKYYFFAGAHDDSSYLAERDQFDIAYITAYWEDAMLFRNSADALHWIDLHPEYRQIFKLHSVEVINWICEGW